MGRGTRGVKARETGKEFDFGAKDVSGEGRSETGVDASLEVTSRDAELALRAANVLGIAHSSSPQNARPSSGRYWGDRLSGNASESPGVAETKPFGIVFDGTEAYAHGVREAVGPEWYLHERGFSNAFTPKEWKQWVGPLGAPLETNLKYGESRVMTVAARDGTRLYYYADGKGSGETYRLLSWKFLQEGLERNPSNETRLIPGDPYADLPTKPLVSRDPVDTPRRFAHEQAWDEYFAALGGHHVLSPGRPAENVYGLPPDKMAPSYRMVDGEMKAVFGAKDWNELVHPDQAVLPTSFTYGPDGFLGSNAVFTVTAKDGSQLYFRKIEFPFFGGSFNYLVSGELLG